MPTPPRRASPRTSAPQAEGAHAEGAPPAPARAAAAGGPHPPEHAARETARAKADAALACPHCGHALTEHEPSGALAGAWHCDGGCGCCFVPGEDGALVIRPGHPLCYDAARAETAEAEEAERG